MDEPERADLIDGLVSSVVSGFQNWKPDFTEDLVLTFKHGPPAVTFDEARKEWHRYVDYRRAIDLRKAPMSTIFIEMKRDWQKTLWSPITNQMN